MKIVAEFMLFANVAVAKKIYEVFPEAALLRRHPFPLRDAFEDVTRWLDLNCAWAFFFDSHFLLFQFLSPFCKWLLRSFFTLYPQIFCFANGANPLSALKLPSFTISTQFDFNIKFKVRVDARSKIEHEYKFNARSKFGENSGERSLCTAFNQIVNFSRTRWSRVCKRRRFFFLNGTGFSSWNEKKSSRESYFGFGVCDLF